MTIMRQPLSQSLLMLVQMVVLKLPSVTLPASSVVDAFTLIEASGVDPFADPGWSMLVSGEHLCGPNSSGAVLLSSTNARVELLSGPTPHIVGSGTVAADSDWQAGVAVGSRVILLRGNNTDSSADLAVLTIATGCTSINSVDWATVARGVSWAGAAVPSQTVAADSTNIGLALSAPTTVFSIASGGSIGSAPRLVAIDLQFGETVTATARALSLIESSPTCTFKGLAWTARDTLIAAAQCAVENVTTTCPTKPDPATANQVCGPAAIPGCPGLPVSKHPYQYGSSSGEGIFCCAAAVDGGHCNAPGGPCCAVPGPIPGPGNGSRDYARCPSKWINTTWMSQNGGPVHKPNVFELSSSTGAVVNTTFVAIQGDSNWAGVVVIDAEADGHQQILLPRNGGLVDGGERTAIVEWDQTGGLEVVLPRTGGVLGPPGRPGMEMDGTAQVWKSVTASDWLGASQGGQQLLALRAYNSTLSGKQQAVNILVYGSATHVLPRRMAVMGTLAQQEQPTAALENGTVNVEWMKTLLTHTHTNTHNWELCSAPQYTQLVGFLEATKTFQVDGRQFRVWVELLPPTEAHPGGDGCQPPADDPRTPFNETSLFNMSTTGFWKGEQVLFPYWDYVGWGDVLGRLAVLYPHLVCLEIDDFTHDVAPDEHGIFTPHVLARMQANLHRHSPTLNWAGNVYFSEEGAVAIEWPDLSLLGDTMLYYFRNQKEGAGPCKPASCKWGPANTGEHAGGCLAGACAVPTVANVAEEVREITAWLPSGRHLIVGFYATGHSSLGSPSVEYVKEIIPTILDQPGVGGIMYYTMLNPCGFRNGTWPMGYVCTGCAGADGAGGAACGVEIELCAKGCVVRDAFGVAAALG